MNCVRDLIRREIGNAERSDDVSSDLKLVSQGEFGCLCRRDGSEVQDRRSRG